jgi:transposase
MAGGYLPGAEATATLKVIETDGTVQVIVKGEQYMRWRSGDEATQRIAIVQLYQNGIGTEEVLAKTFKRHVSSVKRYVNRFEKDGLRGLIPERSGPQSKWKLTKMLRAKILLIALKDGVTELEGVQKRLEAFWHDDISLPSIREVLIESGLWNEKGKDVDLSSFQHDLFDESFDKRQLSLALDQGMNAQETQIREETKDRSDRDEIDQGNKGALVDPEFTPRRDYSSTQRVYLDQLEQGDYNAYAGGLLFAPLIHRYNFLPTLKHVIKCETYEGYNLEELCQTFLYMDLFGFRSMEDFKRAYREEFGALIGRTQSPSLFTLRRFLHKVRELGIGESLIDEFAVIYLKSGVAKYGILYIDGHFLPYHGMFPITKGWHGVRQMPMKGSYHFIAVDQSYRPWLFLIRSSQEDLLEKIPEMIEQAKRIGTKANLGEKVLNRLIVLFDREGYSAKLFRYFDGRDNEAKGRRAIFITWAKYTEKWVYDIDEKKLSEGVRIQYQIKKPEEVKCFETKRHMNKYGQIRAIVIQSGVDKMRTAIYTNATKKELSAKCVVQLMCRRWGEENLIKELLSKHLINYTPGYVFDEIEEQPMVENPEVKELRKERARYKSELEKLKLEFADQVLKKGDSKAEWRKIKKTHLETIAQIARVDNEILLIDQKLDPLAKRVSYEQAHEGEKLMKLNYEKKRFLDAIKVFTYNMKQKMCEILLKYYPEKKEVLSILAMIVERAGFIQLKDGKLNVRLRNFQDREINYVARHLCDELNQMQPKTLDRYHIPIHYEVS